MSWAITILGIVALIVLHELGHFAAAKAVGMRVERFSLFFPPTIAKIRRGETEYAIGAIPAGGYVKITGMSPGEVNDLDPEVARRAYYNKAPWRRIVVILAGPGVNLLIAFVIFAAVLLSGSIGGAITLGNIDPSAQTTSLSNHVLTVERGMPAERVLRPEDRILTVEGHPATILSTQKAIESHRCAGAQVKGCFAATPVHMTVLRDGRTVPITARPRYDPVIKRMLLGFSFGSPRSFSVPEAAGASAAAMWHATAGTVTGIANAIVSPKEREHISSIVGLTQVAQQAVASGTGRGLVVIGWFSLVLGVINLLPFLPLDGGHILWSVAEKLRGRRVSMVAMWRFSSVGLILLAFLVINGIGNDIGRLGG